MSRAKTPVNLTPEVEVKELLADGRRMLSLAVRALIARIEAGEATAADLNASARFAVLLGLDRPQVPTDAASDLREALREFDTRDDRAAGGHAEDGFDEF